MSRLFDRRGDRRSSLALDAVEAQVLVDRADLDAFIEADEEGKASLHRVYRPRPGKSGSRQEPRMKAIVRQRRRTDEAQIRR